MHFRRGIAVVVMLGVGCARDLIEPRPPNQPPPTPELSLVPADPSAADEITLTISNPDFDSDGDPITHIIRWSRASAALDDLDDSRTVPGGRFNRDDAVKVVVTPNDGVQDGDPAEAEFVIADAPPGAPTIQIVPGVAVRDDVLTAEIISPAVDPDGDPVTYQYRWDRNGNPQATETNQILGASVVKGEMWMVRVTPESGGLTGAPATDSLVVGDTVPSAPVISIEPSAPTLLDALEAKLSIASTDADGDPIIYQYAWRSRADGAMSSVDVPGITGPDVPAGTLLAGDTWEVRVTALADGATSEAGVAEVTVQANLPPVLTMESPGTITVAAAPVGYGITDFEGDMQSLLVEYRTSAMSAFADATIVGSGVVGGTSRIDIPSVPTGGVSGVFYWLWSEDEPITFSSDTFELRITALGSVPLQTVTSVPFSVRSHWRAEATQPGFMWTGAGVVDVDNDRMLFYDGLIDDSFAVPIRDQELWITDVNDPEFIGPYTVGSPHVDGAPRAVLDRAGNRMLLVGRELGGPQVSVFALDFTSQRWSQLSVPGTGPALPLDYFGMGATATPLFGAGVALDTNRNKIIWFGRIPGPMVGGPSTTETWRFDLVTRTWEDVTDVIQPPARRFTNLVFDPVADVGYLYGGGHSEMTPWVPCNDFWIYQAANATWRPMALSTGTGQPLPAMLGGALMLWERAPTAFDTLIYVGGLDLNMPGSSQLCYTHEPAYAMMPPPTSLWLIDPLTGITDEVAFTQPCDVCRDLSMSSPGNRSIHSVVAGLSADQLLVAMATEMSRSFQAIDLTELVPGPAAGHGNFADVSAGPPAVPCVDTANCPGVNRWSAVYDPTGQRWLVSNTASPEAIVLSGNADGWTTLAPAGSITRLAPQVPSFAWDDLRGRLLAVVTTPMVEIWAYDPQSPLTDWAAVAVSGSFGARSIRASAVHVERTDRLVLAGGDETRACDFSAGGTVCTVVPWAPSGSPPPQYGQPTAAYWAVGDRLALSDGSSVVYLLADVSTASPAWSSVNLGINAPAPLVLGADLGPDGVESLDDRVLAVGGFGAAAAIDERMRVAAIEDDMGTPTPRDLMTVASPLLIFDPAWAYDPACRCMKAAGNNATSADVEQWAFQH